jgi:hypothetical protein
MAEKNCPVCYSELVEKEVTPCMDCGAHKDGSYSEYEVYFGQRLVLCNFCYVDFSSYNPEYFGFPKNKKVGLQDFNFLINITDTSLRVDKYCPECNKRLAFLRFVSLCRENNSKTDG